MCLYILVCMGADAVAGYCWLVGGREGGCVFVRVEVVPVS